MKKTYYMLAVVACALAVALPAITNAQDDADAESPTNVSSNAAATRPLPPGAPANRPIPGSIREKLRTDYEQRLQNVKNNQEYRNGVLQERRDIATSTRAMIKDARTQGRDMIKNASTTADRREARDDMRTNVFKARQDGMAKELQVSISNLQQIRSRIVSRIEKAEQAGKTMADARTALTVADTKISAAQQAIAAFTAYVPTTSTDNNASTTVPIDFTKPRQVAETAIKSVQTARESLNAVVRAIAHALGVSITATSTVSSSTAQ